MAAKTRFSDVFSFVAMSLFRKKMNPSKFIF